MPALGVVPASRVAMDTSSLLIAFGPLLTFKAPAPKLIISDEFNVLMHVNFTCINKMEAMYGGSPRLAAPCALFVPVVCFQRDDWSE